MTSDLQRREDEMRATFIRRVKDKENELQIAEQSLTNKYNKLKVRHILSTWLMDNVKSEISAASLDCLLDKLPFIILRYLYLADRRKNLDENFDEKIEIFRRALPPQN